MTRRLFLTLLASTSLVLLGFLIPLWVTIGNLVNAQAQGAAVREVQPLISQLPLVATDKLPSVVDSRNADGNITVYLPDGTILGTQVPASPEVTLAQRGSFFSESDEGLLLYAPVTDMAGGTGVVRHLTPAEQIAVPIRNARLVLLALSALLMSVSAFLTWKLAQSFLRPIEALSDTAERLGSGDLSARVVPDGPPEIREIGNLLNRLAERVDELLRMEREDVADLAHRLRTPVTALRLDAEGLADAEERIRLSHDVDRMAAMVDDVIHEARRPVREGVAAASDAVAVVNDRVAFWRVLAEDQGRAVGLTCEPGPIFVAADTEDLGDALDALIGNVFAYTDDDVAFSVVVTRRSEGGAVIAVSDAGPGFDGASVMRGASGSGSTGLGLDIARRTAERSGGTLSIGRAPVLGGSLVRLELGPSALSDTDAANAIRTRRGMDRRPPQETAVTDR
jgi:signal transduction histidine kinase